jgi:hypothetical protein
MTPDRTEAYRRVRRYVERSQHYLENAYASLEQREVEKAGEFLWGSMAQAVKAVAAFNRVRLPSHDALRSYASELSRVRRQPEIYDAFSHAQLLHAGFYEGGYTRKLVMEYGERIKRGVSRLLSLIPREALEA